MRKILSKSTQLHIANRHFIFRRKKKIERKFQDYVIDLAVERDHYTVLELMREVFYCDDPLCASIGVQGNQLMEEKIRQYLREGMSLVARCRYNNCIVGACINNSIQPWDAEVTEQIACSSKDDKVRTLLLFYAHVDRIARDLWTCYDTKQLFELTYVFVKPEHRNRGIATNLMTQSIKLGEDCGFKVIRCDATNYKIASTCHKLGMQLYDAIPYCSYLGRNYEPIFRPPYPNESVKIFIKPFGAPVSKDTE